MRRTGPNRIARTAQPVEVDWRMIALVVICGVALAAGFFFAARQHFLSMDVGFKNSKLRKQLEELENEKRRLLLAKEVSLSPLELRKATRTVVAPDTSAQIFARPVTEKIAQPAATTASLALKSAAALLSKKNSTQTERRSETSDKGAPGAGKRNIEIAAAINLR